MVSLLVSIKLIERVIMTIHDEIIKLEQSIEKKKMRIAELEINIANKNTLQMSLKILMNSGL